MRRMILLAALSLAACENAEPPSLETLVPVVSPPRSPVGNWATAL